MTNVDNESIFRKCGLRVGFMLAAGLALMVALQNLSSMYREPNEVLFARDLCGNKDGGGGNLEECTNTMPGADVDDGCEAGTPYCVDTSGSQPALGDPGDQCAACYDELCNDRIDCTKDSCDPDTGCKHVPDDDLCLTNDKCKIGECTLNGCVYEDKDCNDGINCTREYCDPNTGRCKYEDVCNECEVCTNNGCVVDSTNSDCV